MGGWRFVGSGEGRVGFEIQEFSLDMMEWLMEMQREKMRWWEGEGEGEGEAGVRGLMVGLRI